MTEEHDGGTLVHPRTRWPDEARDFTPWLAKNENLRLLGEAVDLSLERVATEKPVGRYFLDILAKVPGTNKSVAIENQLEWTDTHHLGQLLTYATGCDTEIAIWIATEFCREHARALHRLNGWTNGKVRFYGVKIETIRQTGQSESKPRFRKVVWPGGWNKEITVTPDLPRGMEYEGFFRPVVAELERSGFSHGAHFKRWDNSGRYFRSRINPGISYAASFEGGQHAWVTLHIETGDKNLTKQIFDALAEHRSGIESDIGGDPDLDWQWNRHNRWNYSSINMRTGGSIHDPPEKLGATRKWMLDHLPRFNEVFDPRIENILRDLPPPTPADG